MSLSTDCEAICKHLEGNTGDATLRVFWYATEGDRDGLAHRVSEQMPWVGVYVLRARRFENVNSVASDVATTLNELRPGLEGTAGGRVGICILILARDRFRLPQVASPVMLPAWVPSIGGQEELVLVEDMTARVCVPLNSDHARVREIGAALFSLECAIQSRLEVALEAVSKGNARFGGMYLQRCGEFPGYEQWLDAARTEIRKVLSPDSLRLSARGGLILERVLRLCYRLTPDEVSKFGAALLRDLGFEDSAAPRLPYFGAVLARPSNPNLSGIAWGGLNLIWAVFSASQFSTGAAHADRYPPLPKLLVSSTSEHMVDVLRSYAEWIDPKT